MMILGFDWDDGNAFKNEIKHGIKHSEVEEVFGNFPLMKKDEKHSDSEERFSAFGCTNTGKKLAIAFTVRIINFKLVIRPISARPMSRNERTEYEKTFS